MTKYVKFISNRVVQNPPKNKGSVMNYDKNIYLLLQDGYKELIEVEKPVTNRHYHLEYFVQTYGEDIEGTYIQEQIVYDETQEEADARDLKNAKNAKISENDTARDIALNQGVEYRDVLFDSDTDQKVNLIATVERMEDEDTITWFGMDNQPLVCNKEDLMNIGGLITQLHSFCWGKNYEIKAAINTATTIAELNEIEIDYTLTNEESEEE